MYARARAGESHAIEALIRRYSGRLFRVAHSVLLDPKRAEAVVDYLEKEGVSGDKLVSHGYGKTNFVATNKTREGRAQNRRVELVPAQ